MFGYNPSDLTQLINISHSRPDYPAPVTLEYDALGNLKRDERGNPLHYDALGRLIGVTLPTGQRRWHYGPGGNIIKTEDAAGPRWRYHTSGQLSCEVGESTQTRWVRAGAVPVAESRLASAVREVMLLGTDAQGSVTTEAKNQIQNPVYGAYGQSTAGASRLGYAGALREQDTGWYFLGDYRIYNPVLMRFHSRDSLSPFGEGGLNGYAYCAGDPVNRIDPSGHSWLDWLLPAAGLALALVGTVASLGALAAPAAALTASYVTAVTTATLSVVSLAADVASMALLATGNENAGRILGYVGMATGLASAAPSIASAAARKVKDFGKFVGSGQYRLQHAGGVPKLQDLAFNKGDPREIWLGTRNLNPYGPSKHIIPLAARRYGNTSLQAFDEVREYYRLSRAPLVLPENIVPNVVIKNAAGETLFSVFENNPYYVNEVRLIAANKHPMYLPSELRRANINPWPQKSLTSEFYAWHTSAPTEITQGPVMSRLSQYITLDTTWMVSRETWYRAITHIRR